MGTVAIRSVTIVQIIGHIKMICYIPYRIVPDKYRYLIMYHTVKEIYRQENVVISRAALEMAASSPYQTKLFNIMNIYSTILHLPSPRPSTEYSYA